MATWHGREELFSIRKAAKETCAQRLDEIRNTARTSLGPSRRIDRPLALTKRKAAPDAAFKTRPLLQRAMVSVDETLEEVTGRLTR